MQDASTCVVGIDPGLAITGYGFVRPREQSLELVAAGAITTQADQALPDRLLRIYRELTELLDRYQPTAMAVEQVFFGRNASSALSVGQARGVALLTAALRGIPVFTYTPAEVKEAVVGYGAAEKRQVQEMVRLLLAMPDILRPDDVADAVAVAICHIHTRRLDELETSV